MDRYSRQRILRTVGEHGQQKLAAARVAVVGLGALGSASAECLARAGAGTLVIVDRDVLDESNLHRQILYDEDDVREELPKAPAAERRLREINSDIEIVAHIESLAPGNISAILGGADIILDGTDNIETRYLLNDYAVSNGIPWIYGGAIGTGGTGLLVLPGEGPCLRCIFPDPPDPRKLGTCDTVGVLGPVPVLVGAWQASMAIRWLVQGSKGLRRLFFITDLWEGGFFEPEAGRRDDCPACGRGEFPFLRLRENTIVASLCGSGSFQVTPPRKRRIELEQLASKLRELGEVEVRQYYLRFSEGDVSLCLFQNGAARISGAVSREEAISLYARYVGM
jgi:molybdopterin/thiamine biosynthesis adenylyltransferase